jgi:hypothetical protein
VTNRNNSEKNIFDSDKNPKSSPSILQSSDTSSHQKKSDPRPLLPRFYSRGSRQKYAKSKSYVWNVRNVWICGAPIPRISVTVSRRTSRPAYSNSPTMVSHRVWVDTFSISRSLGGVYSRECPSLRHFWLKTAKTAQNGGFLARNGGRPVRNGITPSDVAYETLHWNRIWATTTATDLPNLAAISSVSDFTQVFDGGIFAPFAISRKRS